MKIRNCLSAVSAPVVLAFALVFCALTGLAREVYVAPAPLGNDGNNGTSVSTPYATITKAFENQSEETIIHIAAGRYVESVGEYGFRWKSLPALTILGEGPETTIIDCAGANRGIVLRMGATPPT